MSAAAPPPTPAEPPPAPRMTAEQIEANRPKEAWSSGAAVVEVKPPPKPKHKARKNLNAALYGRKK